MVVIEGRGVWFGWREVCGCMGWREEVCSWDGGKRCVVGMEGRGVWWDGGKRCVVGIERRGVWWDGGKRCVVYIGIERRGVWLGGKTEAEIEKVM